MSERFERFSKEVLAAGAEGCLPRNLPDEWLDLLVVQATGDDGSVENEELVDPGMTELMAALVAILEFKSRRRKPTFSFNVSEVNDRAREYAVELSLEQINRATDLQTEPATLATIFTDRVLLKSGTHD